MARRSLALVICALAALLDVCVSFAGEEPNSSPTVVRVWQGLGGEIGTAIQAQVDRFNAAHPDIHVEVTIRNGYSGTLKDFRDAVAAGDPPEVAVIEVHSVAALASTGETASLDELIKRDKQFDRDDLLPATLLNLNWKGRLYGLPVTRSAPILYFNKRRFVAAGLDSDKPPQTWGDFREAARKLTTDAERSYGYAATISPWHFESLVLGSGGALVGKNATRSDFVAAGSKPLQLLADMIHRDKSARMADRNAFLQGEAAMLIDSTAMLPIFEASPKNVELGTALVPRWEGEKAGVAIGGGVAVLPAKLPPEKQRAAWTFLTWFIARDQTAGLSRHSGYAPLRKSAVQLLEDEGFYARRPNYRTVVEQLRFARETPAVPSWPRAMSVIGKALGECLAQDESAEAALSRAAGEVDDILRVTSDVGP